MCALSFMYIVPQLRKNKQAKTTQILQGQELLGWSIVQECSRIKVTSWMFISFPSLLVHRCPACFKCWLTCSEHWFYALYRNGFHVKLKAARILLTKIVQAPVNFLSRVLQELVLALLAKVFWIFLLRVSPSCAELGVAQFLLMGPALSVGEWLDVQFQNIRRRGVGAAPGCAGLSTLPALISPLVSLKVSLNSWFLHTRVWIKPTCCIWYASWSFNSRTALLPHPVLPELLLCWRSRSVVL